MIVICERGSWPVEAVAPRLALVLAKVAAWLFEAVVPRLVLVLAKASSICHQTSEALAGASASCVSRSILEIFGDLRTRAETCRNDASTAK